LAEFEALEERRMVEIRHARFNAGLTAAMIYNANRSADSEPLEVWDFLPGFEQDPLEAEAEKHRKELKRAVSQALCRVATEPMEKVQEVRAYLIARIRDNGIEDPEGLIREVFPDLE
jgi:hypothetical protein